MAVCKWLTLSIAPHAGRVGTGVVNTGLLPQLLSNLIDFMLAPWRAQALKAGLDLEQILQQVWILFMNYGVITMSPCCTTMLAAFFPKLIIFLLSVWLVTLTLCA